MTTALHADAADRYLELLKGCLTRLVFADEDFREVVLDRQGWQRRPAHALKVLLQRGKVRLVHSAPDPFDKRARGLTWPQHAETMVGLARLDNIRACVEDVLSNDVPGDLVETGVWRGGASIYMKAVLTVRGDRTRRVWLADSFEGGPKPNAALYPADDGLDFYKHDVLAVGVDQVRRNFERYELLDDRVEFLVGWFSETLPTAPIDKIAVLRLDGDLYESTTDALRALYPKVSRGGYVIVDDYQIDACRQAIDDYRREHEVEDSVVPIDESSVFWKLS